MSDDEDKSQKTEEPTSHHLDQARAKGDVIKSQELVTFATMVGVTVVVALLGPRIMRELGTTLTVFLASPEAIPADGESLRSLVLQLLGALALIVGPVFLVMAGSGIVGHTSQAQLMITGDRIEPKLSRIDPLAGLKRIFGMQGLVNLGKGIVKLAVVGTILWAILWSEREALPVLVGSDPVVVLGVIKRLVLKMLAATLVCLSVVAAADYLYQRHDYMQRHRMSRQEIKDEFKQTEGDPKVKARLRQIRHQRARRRMMAAVPSATVVVMNPTHFAVALKYEPTEMAAPLCVAKGTDLVALRIRALAEESGVPVIENPPLARTLHAAVEIDEAIPPEHYKAVAEVIAFVLKLSRKAGQRPPPRPAPR